MDLLHLDSTVNEESEIAQAKSNDLNGVFHAKGIVDQNQLVEEPETVEGEEGGDGLRGGTLVRLLLDLEVREDITKRRSQLASWLLISRA